MQVTAEHNKKIAAIKFSSVYPHFFAKIECKGRSKEELHEVIKWLTGFGEKEINELIKEEVSFEIFFKKATFHQNAALITGTICGYKIEHIENDLTRQMSIA